MAARQANPTARLKLRTAARDCCRTLRKQLRRAAEGKCDAEDIHGLRTACRRIESLLRELATRSRLRGDSIEDVKADIRRVRKRAGAIRDLDVACGLLQKLARDRTLRPGLELLETRFQRDRIGAMKRLARCAGRGRIDRLPARIDRVLAKMDVTQSRVERVVRQLRTRITAAAMAPGLTPGELHRVRLTVKRLRDLAELAAPVLGGGSPRIARAAKRLSTQLGQPQDLVTLLDLTDAMAGEDAGSADTLARLRAKLHEEHERTHQRTVQRLRSARERAILTGG